MAWEAVADLDQLDDGDPMRVDLAVDDGRTEPLCVVRLGDDEVVAVHNVCTHQQQPLDEGYVQEDDTLVCPAHNSCFDLRTGESVGVPAVPTLPVYACTVDDGVVWVDAAQQLNDAAAPGR